MRTLAQISMLFCLLFAGCGSQQADYSELELVDVKGVLKLEGQPVGGAVIIVEDLNTGLQSYGLTDASGRYRLQFDSVKSGTIPGDKKVIVSTTKKVYGLNSEEEGEGGESNETPATLEDDLIPEAYRIESKLRVTIEKGTRNIDFDLAEDGSTNGPV